MTSAVVCIQALRWLKADCDGEISIHEKLIAKNACMFGATGATEAQENGVFRGVFFFVVQLAKLEFGEIGLKKEPEELDFGIDKWDPFFIWKSST